MVQSVLNQQWCGFSFFQTTTSTCKKMATLTSRYCGFGHFQIKCFSCWKTAEISAIFQQCLFSKDLGIVLVIFQQSTVFVGKRPKFRPFSNSFFSLRLWALFLPFSNNYSPYFLGVVGKWPKFRPFSNKHSRLFENGRNFGRFPTIPNVSAVFQQLCFGRFPTTGFGRFPTNFRPFYS